MRNSSTGSARGAGLAWLAVLAGIVGGIALVLLGRRRIAERRAEERRNAVRSRQGRLPRVVIVGGGLGGLFCARALKNAPVEVVLIDRANHYLYQALIYQVATGQLDESEVAMPIRERVGRNPNTSVLMAEVTVVDVDDRRVGLKDGSDFEYDYLVLATGLEANYFGHDEWAEHAPTLKTLSDALRLREEILVAFEQAEKLDDPASRPDLTTFVMVGAGPTGVELAGAIADMVHHTLPREFKRFDPRLTRVVLVEEADRVLPSFAPDISEKVKVKLQKMGVEVRLGLPVECIDEQGTVVGGERIASRNVIWTAGVRATPVGEMTGLATDSMGRVVVERDLTVPGHPEIYAIGDIAHQTDRDGHTLPGVAQVALQGGRYAGRSILHLVTGEALYPYAPGGTPPGPFEYFDKGFLAAVGRGYGVMETMHGRVKLTGLPAKFVWAFVHLLYQMPNSDKVTMFTKWAWASATRRLGTRIIVSRGR